MKSGKTIEKTIEKISEIDTIESICKDLFEELDVIKKREQQNENEGKEIKSSEREIILRAANRMEAFKSSHNLPTDTICNELYEILRPRGISERYIRKCLPKKFKNKTKSENAISKVNKPSSKELLGRSAELVPQTPITWDEKKLLPDIINKLTHQKKKEESTPPLLQDMSKIHIDKSTRIDPKELLETESKSNYSNDGSTYPESILSAERIVIKCLECLKKDKKILHLENRINQHKENNQKIPLSMTADKLILDPKDGNIINKKKRPFKFRMYFESLRKDMVLNNRKVTNDTEIEFSGLIDDSQNIDSINWVIMG